MSRFGLIVFLMMVSLLASASAAAAALGDGPVLNIGHRGASGHAPEHTIAAYDLALEQGADYIEIDLQMTADGVLVALHDKTLNRTADAPEGVPEQYCRGLVSEKTLEQIQMCDVGSWFSPEYAGLQIPTLDEIFHYYEVERNIDPNYYIETKNPDAAPGMEEELLRLMGEDEYGLIEPAAEDWRVLIQSFSAESLMKIHALEPSLPLIQLYWAGSSKAIQRDFEAASAYAVGIGPYKKDVDADLVAAAHELCLAVHPYTVNETAEMEALISLGVDGMFTNFPDRLEQVLGENAVDGTAAAPQAAEAYAACRVGL
jgi:glycerophosphoryl diester phosphodiesterase